MKSYLVKTNPGLYDGHNALEEGLLSDDEWIQDMLKDYSKDGYSFEGINRSFSYSDSSITIITTLILSKEI